MGWGGGGEEGLPWPFSTHTASDSHQAAEEGAARR